MKTEGRTRRDGQVGTSYRVLVFKVFMSEVSGFTLQVNKSRRHMEVGVHGGHRGADTSCAPRGGRVFRGGQVATSYRALVCKVFMSGVSGFTLQRNKSRRDMEIGVPGGHRGADTEGRTSRDVI